MYMREAQTKTPAALSNAPQTGDNEKSFKYSLLRMEGQCQLY